MTAEMDDTYNGWKNKETWLVNVHDVFEPRGDLEEIARRAYEENGSRGAAIADVEDAIKDELDQAQDYARELLDQGGHAGAIFLLDMLGVAFARVDTRRLAEHIVDDTPGIQTKAREEAAL
jgi:hypothetical protein